MSLDHFPEGRDRHVVYGAWGMFFMLIPLSVVGARALRRKDRLMPLMLLPIPAALFTVAITFGNTRYRLAAEPALILLGSVGLVSIADRLARLWRAPELH
jgi:4-amino-4-deoxy-L-arabinose transferase-like glycosyltransferase